MKRPTIILIVFFFFSGKIQAQCPDPDGWYPYWFDTQGEIDNFALNYPNCTEIPLLRIYQENGDEHDLIHNLDGFSGITSVTGDVSIEHVDIDNLHGLHNITTIEGDLSIEGIELANLSGLESLTHVGGDLLPPSSSVYDYRIHSLSGLENLTHIGGDFIIYGEYLPSILAPLSNLTTVGGNLSFMEMVISHFNGLENLTSIGGELRIFRAGSDISAFANLNSMGSLYIRFNSGLSVCNIPPICNHIAEGKPYFIADNAPGCNSEAEVEAACFVPVSSPEDTPDINFFPNPNFGQFEVKGITSGTYQIYDTKGRIIQEGSLINDSSIDISEAVQGVYFISFFIDNQIYTKKIVKM